jgi:hypothetical protein
MPLDGRLLKAGDGELRDRERTGKKHQPARGTVSERPCDCRWQSSKEQARVSHWTAAGAVRIVAADNSGN